MIAAALIFLTAPTIRVAAEDGSDEFHSLASELRASLSEHINRLRAKIAEFPVAIERRSH